MLILTAEASAAPLMDYLLGHFSGDGEAMTSGGKLSVRAAAANRCECVAVSVLCQAARKCTCAAAA